MIEEFVEYCKENLDLTAGHYTESYQSLSTCVLDCVYSLRAKYYSMTVPVVERYAAHFMEGNRFAPGDTLETFIKRVDSVGGAENFASEILNNRQKSGGVLKADICYHLAKKLQELRINTLADFQNYENQEALEQAILSIKGIGTAGENYLFMLAGDPDRCKPDVHIHHCIVDACGEDISNQECQTLFSHAVEILRREYPEMTVKKLDGLIWSKYRAGKVKSENQIDNRRFSMAGFTSQITFLDFEDYASGKDFFSRVLRLENVYDIGWAAVYSVEGKAFLGVVDRKKSKVPVKKEGLLISLTTDSLEEWHRHISAFCDVSPIAEVKDAGLKSFFFEGPEGYRFEIEEFSAELPRTLFC